MLNYQGVKQNQTIPPTVPGWAVYILFQPHQLIIDTVTDYNSGEMQCNGKCRRIL